MTVLDEGHTNGNATSSSQVALTIVAASVLVMAFLGFTGFLVHFANAQSPNDHQWHGNDPDPLGSMLGFIWFISALVATILSRSLRSPARELILVGGGMLTTLSVLFWFSVGMSR
jgi:hypothetical protein